MYDNGKMTIIEIAKEAGVSIAAVSRVINGSSVVSESTRKRADQEDPAPIQDKKSEVSISE